MTIASHVSINAPSWTSQDLSFIKENAGTRKMKMSRPKFSLRNFFLVLSIAMVALGVMIVRVKAWQQQRDEEKRAIDNVRQVGAELKFGKVRTPWYIRPFGPDAVDTVTGISIAPGSRGAETPASVLRELPAFANVESLDLEGAKLSESDFGHLDDLRQLRHLNLASTQANDSMIQILGDMENLEYLNLFGNHRITDRAFDNLHDLAHLKEFHGPVSLGNDGLKVVCNWNALQVLILDYTNIDDGAFEYIRHLENLRTLSVKGTKVAGHGIVKLSGLVELASLNLDDTLLTNETTWEFGELRALSSLQLRAEGVVDGGLEFISKLRELVEFRAPRRVSVEGLQCITALPRLKVLDLSETLITDEIVPILIACRQLEFVDLNFTGVTAAGEARLREAMPQLTVHRDF